MTFTLQVPLYYTTNDFPAYPNLSGWSMKGHFACPVCAKATKSLQLKNGYKFCYMDHHRQLPKDLPFRYDKDGFDGNTKLGSNPTSSTRSQVLVELAGIIFTYEKGQANVNVDKQDEEQIREKSSVFFNLQYWQFNHLHHNLDVMHVEKNICDKLLGTLLNLEGKSEDNLKVHQDL